MKILSYCIFVFLLFGVMSMPLADEGTNIPKTVKSVFGLKSDLSQFPGKTESEVVDILSKDGINAVFGGYENPKLREELKKRNIKVYAEIGIFAGANYWKSHPESQPITDSGKPMEKEEWYGGLCPNQEWLRKEKLNAIKSLCTKYKVDGVWLDFIRYPCHWEVKKPKLINTCFCDVCLAKFQKETSIKIPNSEKSTAEKAKWILTKHREEWTYWRCNVITQFVKEAKEVIKKESPDILVGLFGVPWQSNDYDNAIINIIAQDYKSLAPFVDVFSPMVYHKMCYRDTAWVAEVTQYLTKITQKPVVPIIQACSIPTKMDNQEFQDTLVQAEKKPSSGVIVFTLDYVQKEKKMDTLKMNFRGLKE